MADDATLTSTWEETLIIEIGFEVEMSQVFPDVGRIGKLTKTARGANLRALKLGCAKHYGQPCP